MYNAGGNITQRTDTDGSVTTFGYDASDQLTSEVRTGSSPYTLSYTYDDNHNRLTKTLNGVTETYTYGAHDKLLTAGSKTYTYDANGNCTSVTSGTSTTTLTYDYENRVKTITYPNSSTNTFNYNGLGLRVNKTDSSGVFNYVTDGTGVASPVLKDSAATYTPGLSERRGTTSKFLHGDHLGSTRGITDSTQTVTDAILYDGFGMVVTRTGTTPTPFGFVGGSQYQTDADSGLMLLGHRYYDAGTGRFISQDPIHDGTNWYAYCRNNPLTRTDALGLEEDDGLGDLSNAGMMSGRGAALNEAKDFIDFLAGYFVPGYDIGAGVSGQDLWGRQLDLGDRVGRVGGEIIPGIGGWALGMGGRLGGRGRGGCFVAGTLVAMADGSFKPIERIKVGDEVASRDEYGDGESKVVSKKVKRFFIRTDVPTMTLQFSNGETIETTAEHPFFVKDKGWVPAGQLAIGNAIVTRAGPSVSIRKIVRHPAGKTVYNFEVEDTHTYFVGKTRGGLWVHNSCDVELPVNQLGDQYPQHPDPRTGDMIPFPDNPVRIDGPSPGWTGQDKRDYIVEYLDRGYPVPDGGWSGNEIHHILPRKYGGGNDFDNLVPLPPAIHLEYTNWWRHY